MVAKSERPSSVVHDCASLVIDRELDLQPASLAVIQDQGLNTADITPVGDEAQSLRRRNERMVYFILLYRSSAARLRRSP